MTEEVALGADLLERRLGRLEQVGDRASVARIAGGSRARGHPHERPGRRDCALHRADHPRHQPPLLLFARVRQQDGEVVALEPGHDVLAAHHRECLEGDVAQELVPLSVPELLVDAGELVEVESQQGEGLAPAAGARERGAGALLEATAVREAGQRVREGEGLGVSSDAGDPLALDEHDEGEATDQDRAEPPDERTQRGLASVAQERPEHRGSEDEEHRGCNGSRSHRRGSPA